MNYIELDIRTQAHYNCTFNVIIRNVTERPFYCLHLIDMLNGVFFFGPCLGFPRSHILFQLSKSESLNQFKRYMWSLLSLLLLWSRNLDNVLTSLKCSPADAPSGMLYIVYYYCLSLRMFFNARSRISSLRCYPTNMSESNSVLQQKCPR